CASPSSSTTSGTASTTTATRTSPHPRARPPRACSTSSTGGAGHCARRGPGVPTHRDVLDLNLGRGCTLVPMTFPRLHGRDDELGRIDRMLAELRTGGGQALVFRGEAGIGKSALLAHAASSADGLFLLRGGGSEGESTLPYAGLHLL